MPRGKIISCLKADKMIVKGFLYHVVRVMDLEWEIRSIEFVPIVREFPEVFQNYLQQVPPNRKLTLALTY